MARFDGVSVRFWEIGLFCLEMGSGSKGTYLGLVQLEYIVCYPFIQLIFILRIVFTQLNANLVLL